MPVDPPASCRMLSAAAVNREEVTVSFCEDAEILSFSVQCPCGY